MAEKNRADRTGHESETEGGQRRQQRRRRIALGEEQQRKHRHGGRGVDVEVVELDGGTNHRRNHNAPAWYPSDQIAIRNLGAHRAPPTSVWQTSCQRRGGSEGSYAEMISAVERLINRESRQCP